MSILKNAGVKSYSKFERVLGKGERTEPRLNTDVWPGFNSALIVGIKEGEKEKKLLDELKKFSNDRQGKGICVFVLPLEQII